MRPTAVDSTLLRKDRHAPPDRRRPHPAPALFDVTTTAPADPAGTLVRVPLDDIELAPNARREIAPEGIERLARMLMTMGQLVPCIGHRPAGSSVVLYAGQRRLLAARASHTLAARRPAAGAQPDRAAARPRALGRRDPPHPGPGEPARGPHARRPAGPVRRLLGRPRRPARAATGSPPSAPTSASAPSRPTTCAASSRCPSRSAPASPNARRTPALGHARQPPGRHARRRPRAHRRPSPQRISTPELHDAALRDLGAFVHRTIVEDETRLRRAHRRRRPARRARPARRSPARTSPTDGRRQAAARARLRARRARRRARRARRPRPSAPTRRCASTPRCASAPAPAATPTCTTAAPTSPPASGSSTPCSCSTPSARRSPTTTTRRPRPTRPTSPAPASTRPTCATPPPAERERRHEQRQRQADAVRTNLGLGHDLRAGLIDPSPAQLDALRAIVCHLLARDYRDVIAYGAGWTDPERQRPVGESGRHEPMADRRDRRGRTASARSTSPTRCAASPRSSRAAPPRSCSTPTASRAPRCSAASA